MRFEKKHYEIMTDPEFEALHFRPMGDALKKLEENILKYGVSHSLIVWDGILVDGYKRYEVCRRHNVPFPIYFVDFKDRDSAKTWICDQNLLRRDLPEESKKYYLGKKYLIAYGDGKKAPEGDYEASQIRIPAKRRGHIAKNISSSANLSAGAVMKYSRYAKALDDIRSREPGIFSKILNGQIKISQENTIAISMLSTEDFHILRDFFMSKGNDRISNSEIWHELQWGRIHVSVPTRERKPKSAVTPAIKQMPAYDPDAELSSLTLTIPSWIRSIQRVAKNADFNSATPSARERLWFQLMALAGEADHLMLIAKENSHEQYGN